MTEAEEREARIADLEEALAELLSYTEAVLTGPMARKYGVRWPQGKPMGPTLVRARELLAKPN